MKSDEPTRAEGIVNALDIAHVMAREEGFEGLANLILEALVEAFDLAVTQRIAAQQSNATT